MELNFEYFYKWAMRYLNLDLESYKQKQLQRRIGTIMKTAGASNLEEYAKLIEKDDDIRTGFLDYITINVTEFFRNKDIFNEFESVVVNQLYKKFGPLNIWSAACSVGAEPYSLAIILDKTNTKLKNKILATDIDDGILAKAKEAVYKDHEVKNISKADLGKYFTEKDSRYELKDNIKKMVNFKKHDLILENYEKGFHAIICRNVVIYFKNETKNKIYQKFSDSLEPGGVLFTGATESIYNPESFGFRKLSTFIYEKI